ncbi:MAG: ABC transporter ATP-binding protein [Kiloniellales bacterium]|nr:ABC transporter ATP-binding protein [Kiloniellales bacterium]
MIPTQPDLRSGPRGEANDAILGIEAVDLEKRFSGAPAVRGFRLSAGVGTLALIGPNGAGKSTAMRMLAGLYLPDAGAAKICGHDVVRRRREAQAHIGYLPEAAGGLGHLSVLDFLTYCGEARGLRGRPLLGAMRRVADRVDLGPALGAQMRTLSKGWRQRAWLAQALLHDPPVLILDEPTDGLDPVQRDHVRALVRAMAKRKTILLSTHVLEEAEEVCERTVILANGTIVADAPTVDLCDARGRLAPAFRRLMGATVAGPPGGP